MDYLIENMYFLIKFAIFAKYPLVISRYVWYNICITHRDMFRVIQ